MLDDEHEQLHHNANDTNTKPAQVGEPPHEHHPVYAQLFVSETRIRVLVLHPSSSDAAPVSCTLEVMTLDPAPSRAYTALSYVWGDASVTENITVNGASFAVTTNLAQVLQQIRNSFGETALWADAICMYLRRREEKASCVFTVF